MNRFDLNFNWFGQIRSPKLNLHIVDRTSSSSVELETLLHLRVA
ncbi:hypothetical protein F442_03022 [Phytophthora nicotianae P10297]|uniref:Uncharacterized protein n=1 Tax=Phytophthora nicotianae P10297 TaxID=1317064 RepID=W2ZY04_PHYNI|nr:hypothetical protein F442_03022 [Phytophthora nicotianae P10297]